MVNGEPIMRNIDLKKWDRRFMDVAKLVATWSTCIRDNRQVGAVIVQNNRIVATGYNGAPAGVRNCMERGECMRNRLKIESGTQLEKCYSICAEQNAIAQAAKLGHSTNGATIYTTHRPCPICTKLIINCGISRIVYEKDYPNEFSLELINETGIDLDQIEEQK